MIQTWIRAERVRVDGKATKAGYSLRPGEEVEVDPPAPEPSQLLAEPIPLNIVYEDEWLVVVDKPAGIVVHPGPGSVTGLWPTPSFIIFDN